MYKLTIDCGTAIDRFELNTEDEVREHMKEFEEYYVGITDRLFEYGVVHDSIDTITLTKNSEEKVLVKYNQDFGRMGSLDGLFICTKEDLESLNGKDVYFGEVLGKHSEVYTGDTYKYCKIVPTQHGDIKVLERLLGEGTISGFNPFDYIEDCCELFNEGEEE